MKLLVVLTGKGSWSANTPVHLVRDGESESLCGKAGANTRWTLRDDTPNNRKKYIDDRGKAICWLCDHRVLAPSRTTIATTEQPQMTAQQKHDQEKLDKWIKAMQ